MSRANRIWVSRPGGRVVLGMVLLWMGGDTRPGLAAEGNADAAARGRDVLARMLEVNRHWLERPPSEVETYAYDFRLRDRDPERVRVDNASRARGPTRQGITYRSVLHAVAERPAGVVVRSYEEEGGQLRLSLQFEDAIRGDCGNGLSGHWYGYFNLGGEFAELVLDAETLTPLRSRIGNVTETFGSYVELAPGHRVPLSITIERGDKMRFDWSFRVHEPGLWLLDESRYGQERVAWTEAVQVNEAPAVTEFAESGAVARREAEIAGSQRLATFLAANRHWLAPSAADRRGLVYDYRQEDGYRERVWFAPDGWILAELESARGAQEGPMRRRAWLPDGRWIASDAADTHVRVEGEAGGGDADAGLQALGMGLRLDCALTRLARSPDAAWAEILPDPDSASHYILVLHWTGDARLFTGTMLSFTSWAYMHDVRYQRSEIRCEAATQRPLQEIDFDADGNVVGRYWFEDFQPAAAGDVPGRIRAEIPHRKDDADQTLDMTAAFRVDPRWGWLLREVHSTFRGGAGGSTGTVAIVETPDFDAVTDVADRCRATETLLDAVSNLGEGGVDRVLPADGEWIPAPVRAGWSEQAAEAERGWRERENAPATLPVVAVTRARLESAEDGGPQIRLEGISTSYLREYDVRWSLELGASADPVTTAFETPIRCERNPTTFSVAVPLPADAPIPADAQGIRMRLHGTVTAFAGAYHGHGMWFRVARP